MPEAALAQPLDDLGLDHEAAPGEASFYGPRIDVQIPGRGGRVESYSFWRQSTAHLPAPSGLVYAGRQPRPPVMAHRTVISTLERCILLLLEQHSGNLPLWLAHVQVAVVSVRDRRT
jgi:threonyl-tRNA synthetase